MAKFGGTLEEFNKFVGMKTRNAVNNLTRRMRMDLSSICDEDDSYTKYLKSLP